MKYNIGFDLDGIICNSYEPCFKVLKEMYPDRVKSNVWQGEWEKDFNLTNKEVENCFIECGKRGIFRDAPIYKDCKWLLYKFARYYNIFFVTWRNYIPNAREDTLYWLDSNKIPYYRLIVTFNKFKIAESENFVFYLDDSPSFCNRVAKTKVPTYLFRRPWNKNEELDALVKVVNSWYDVKNILLPH